MSNEQGPTVTIEAHFSFADAMRSKDRCTARGLDGRVFVEELNLDGESVSVFVVQGRALNAE